MMNKHIKIELEFYFVYDGLIVAHSTDYSIIWETYIRYYEKYGYNHDYSLYAVNKYNFKDLGLKI